MDWKVVLFESNRGEKQVSDFIRKQRPQAIAKIAHIIDLLELHGSMLGMPHAKRLEHNLYELRIRGKKRSE